MFSKFVSTVVMMARSMFTVVLVSLLVPSQCLPIKSTHSAVNPTELDRPKHNESTHRADVQQHGPSALVDEALSGQMKHPQANESRSVHASVALMLQNTPARMTTIEDLSSTEKLSDYPRSWLTACDEEMSSFHGTRQAGFTSQTDFLPAFEADLAKSVFTRWGASSCPEGASLLYVGFMAGSSHTHGGSGANYLCMHPNPEFPPGASDASNNGALLYGTEYQNTGSIDKNHNQDAACAVCERPGAVQTYVQWGRQTCSSGHDLEYAGVVMANKYDQTKSEFICVDYERAVHAASSTADQNGALLYTTEMESGSSDESKYPANREVGCAVCSVLSRFEGAVYERWGARTCPNGAVTLYEGFMAGSSHTHGGSGANYLCMHPNPEFPPGASDANNNGALLYGTEYQNTGSIDKNNNQDAACAMCQRPLARQTYVQWGRQTCSNGHFLEYAGVVMANKYDQKKSEFICVDYERAAHAASSTADHNGALLYTTEMESGSSDSSTYPTNREVGCAVCSIVQPAPFPPPSPPPPPPVILGSFACTDDCAAVDHVTYLPREGPVFDQWGKSHFVASTKPSTPTPNYHYTFHSEKLTVAEAEHQCMLAGANLPKLDSAEKIAGFKQALENFLQSGLSSSSTATHFEVIYDATFKTKVYDKPHSVDETKQSEVFWVHRSSSVPEGRAAQCGTALANASHYEVASRLSKKYLTYLAGNVLQVEDPDANGKLPTMCMTADGYNLEFDYGNLLGADPPYSSAGPLLRSAKTGSVSVEKVDAMCHICHKDYGQDARECVTFGPTDGLFASGATSTPGAFNCDDMTLPYVCETVTFDGSNGTSMPASCVSDDDLIVFPTNAEAAGYPTFVKTITFYHGKLPIVGAHPSATEGGISQTYITGMDVVMNDPENLGSKKLSQPFTTVPLGTRMLYDGSASEYTKCEFEYGDTIDGLIEIQSAMNGWGIGYLKWQTKRGATCEVGAPAYDPKYLVGLPHGAYRQNALRYMNTLPTLVYGQCTEGYVPVTSRDECTKAFKLLFEELQVSGQDETTNVQSGYLPGLQGCYLDEQGNGKFQQSASKCDDEGGTACDAFYPICELENADLQSPHGRRSMSYVDADGRMLARVGYYNILNEVRIPPTTDNFDSYLLSRPVHFGGFAPIFLKKIVEVRYDLPNPIKFEGDDPVPRPKSLASHTYCNEDDVPRAFGKKFRGAYERAITYEVGNEYCYTSSFSMMSGVDVSVNMRINDDSRSRSVGYEHSDSWEKASCSSTTQSLTELFAFPYIELPARSVVQYTYTRRETVYRNAKVKATEVIVYDGGGTEDLGTQLVKLNGIARSGTLATFSEIGKLGHDGMPASCGYGVSSLGAVRPTEPSEQQVEAQVMAEQALFASLPEVPAEYADASLGCAYSALNMQSLKNSATDWSVQQLLLDVRGQVRGFSIADPLYSDARCNELVAARPFVGSTKPRSFVTALTFIHGPAAWQGMKSQNIIQGIIVQMSDGSKGYFGQTAFNGQSMTSTTCQIPGDSFLAGSMHIGSEGKGSSARFGYIKFDVKGSDGKTTTCEPVTRDADNTKIRTFYVERRKMSGIIASGFDPLKRFGGMTEFAVIFWKRITKMEVVGARGSDEISGSELGEPDIPSPSNEYFQSYCNEGAGQQTFGETIYVSSMAASNSVTVTEASGRSLSYGDAQGTGVSFKFTICTGLGVAICKTPVDFSFNVELSRTREYSWEKSSTSEQTTTTTSEKTILFPAVELAGHEATEYKMTLFKRKMKDVTVQLMKKMHFEDGTTALSPPEDYKMEGVLVMSSMSSYQKQRKNITGCSYILEPAPQEVNLLANATERHTIHRAH